MCEKIESAKAPSLLLNKVDTIITDKGDSGLTTVSVLDTKRLIHYIADLKRLINAYEEIKSKPGNLTKAVNNETLDGLTLSSLKNMSEQLRAGKFEFKLSRRVLIPKGVVKIGSRPITMAPPRDKIVQKSIANALTVIYEPLFLDYSHGYRLAKSCHTALDLVDRTFRGAK